MGRILGMLFVIAALWVGVEVYNEGVDRAFGGALAILGDAASDEPGERAGITQRVGSATREAQRRADERRDRLIGD